MNQYPNETRSINAPSREPQTVRAVQNLSQSIDRMEKTVATLNERLQPIMRCPSPSDTVGQMKGGPEEMLCELAQHITERTRRLDSLTATLDETLSRIEV